MVLDNTAFSMRPTPELIDARVAILNAMLTAPYRDMGLALCRWVWAVRLFYLKPMQYERCDHRYYVIRHFLHRESTYSLHDSMKYGSLGCDAFKIRPCNFSGCGNWMQSISSSTRWRKVGYIEPASSPGEIVYLAQTLVPRPHFSHGKEKVAIHPVSNTAYDNRILLMRYKYCL